MMTCQIRKGFIEMVHVEQKVNLMQHEFNLVK